jgi:hypothetical protein
VVNGQTLHLNYHTTVGDLGAGDFYGVTTGGPYTDNDGTIIVPTGGDGSAAWLRVWDHVRAHVGWFGAKCQPDLPTGPDDYAAVQKCLYLFTSGRIAGGGHGGGSLLSGIIDVGPGFNFSQPLIYGGSLASSFKWVGRLSRGRGGQERSFLRYTGPKTHAAFIMYGANEWGFEDVNVCPGLAMAGILATADNSYNNNFTHTTSVEITAGADRVVSPLGGATPAEKVQYLQPGVFLGVGGRSDQIGGAAAGADFEIVYITAVDRVAGTFTADFAKTHPAGSLLGGGHPCSSGWVKDCQFQTASSPIWTLMSGPAVDLGIGPLGGFRTRFPVDDITGIKVGHPIRVGSLLYAEVLYPDVVNVGASYFEAYSNNFGHTTGHLVMYPTSGMALGNRLLGTVQTDNVTFSSCTWTGMSLRNHPGTTAPEDQTADCYAGFRQIWGGNVKAFVFNNMQPAYLRCGFACEQASGQYHFNGGTSAAIYECIWWGINATMTVLGWEDESTGMWLTGLGGSSPSQATFIGCTFQGAAPVFSHMPQATDEMILYSGQVTMIGCYLINNRIPGTTLPLISITGLLVPDVSNNPPGLVLLNCTFIYATASNMNLVRNGPGGTVDVLQDGSSGSVTMLNCIGNNAPTNTRLPNVLPPIKRWQNTATYDPPSLLANTAGTAQTMSVPGAVLGDLVEVSFSQNLGEVLLRAWVSAADTVSFQFRNPTASPIDLASGTVKCRVKK